MHRGLKEEQDNNSDSNSIMPADINILCNGIDSVKMNERDNFYENGFGDDRRRSDSSLNSIGSLGSPNSPPPNLIEIKEQFHTNMTNGYANRAESTFAGRRDVKSPTTLAERQIISAKGTVRGFRNRVRAGIATFIEPFSEKAGQDGVEEVRNYHLQEKDKIVIYTTSMSVVRNTHEKCKVVRNILQTNMVRYEERDLYMSKENQKELRERVDSNDIRVPQVFADGELIGGAAELEKLNESGELRNIFHNYPKVIVTSNCRRCGGYRFVPCIICHGSKKSVHRNHFTEEFCALRCMQCDDNGLQRCDLCREQQE